MLKEEFEVGYCERSGITREWYREHCVSLPCGCADEECLGWARTSLDGASIVTQLLLYRPDRETLERMQLEELRAAVGKKDYRTLYSPLSCLNMYGVNSCLYLTETRDFRLIPLGCSMSIEFGSGECSKDIAPKGHCWHETGRSMDNGQTAVDSVCCWCNCLRTQFIEPPHGNYKPKE